MCLDITEVTTAAYGVCVEDGGCPPVGEPKVATPQQCNYVIAGHEQHPINCIDEFQAAAYCTWAGKRVPREREWVWAAQGRSRATTYPWGHAPVDAVRVCWQRDKNGTCVVGGRPAGASPDGIFDLVGNVAEWTTTGDLWRARGGSWRDSPASASGLAVDNRSVGYRAPEEVGVRCVVDPHTPVRTIDSQSWTPRVQAQVAPVVRVYPDVAPRPVMPTPGRPLANLAPLWHEHLENVGTSNTEWPLADTYRKVDPAVAKTLGLSGSIDPGKWPAALADFDPFLSAGPLVMLSKGRQYSSHVVALERDSSAIRWQRDFAELGRRYNWLLTPKTLVLELSGRSVDAVVGIALVDGSEAFRMTGPFSSVQSMWQDDDRAYLIGDQGLLAFDPVSGQNLWGPVAVGKGCGAASGEGVVVIEDPDEGHRVLDATTGVQKRRIQTGVRGECRWGGYRWDHGVASGAIVGGKLIAAQPSVGKRGPAVYAYDLVTGKQVWRRKNVGPHVLAANQDAVYFDRAGSILVAVDPTTGRTQAEISIGHGIVELDILPAGGLAGPLVVVTDDVNGRWVLGRQEVAPKPEAYTIRGKIVRRDESDLKRRHLAGVPVRIGEKSLRSTRSGQFSARGKAIGAVLVDYDGPTEYDDFQGEAYSRTLTRFDSQLVVLRGQKSYTVDPIELYEWWLE